MRKNKFSLPKLLNNDSALPYAGLSFTEEDLSTVSEILSYHSEDQNLLSTIGKNPGESLCFLLYIYNHYTLLSNSCENFTISAQCAIDMTIEFIKENPESIHTGMVFTEAYDKVQNFIYVLLQDLNFNKAKSYIEIYQSDEDTYSAAFCVNVKLGKYYVQTMRFVDDFTLVRRLLLREEPKPKLTSKGWAVSCESVPQVFATDVVTFSSFPKLLNVRIKHIKKKSMDNILVEVIDNNTVLSRFSVVSIGSTLSASTIAAYAYYVVSCRFHEEYSHVNVKSNIDLNIDNHTPLTLSYDLLRVACVLFPVSQIEYQKKITIAKSKITEKIKATSHTFGSLSRILNVETNVGKFQLTRHAVLRCIERVLIVEGIYIDCAFVFIKNLLTQNTWRKATQEEKNLYELQIDDQSTTLISDDTPYCFVGQGNHLLTVVVKNFKDSVEAANVLRD